MADVIGIIPARGGSTRVPRKNIRQVGGVPLIAHTIQATSEASVIDDFVVSTDDDEIATISEEYGATICQRPSELAEDESPMGPVITHTLEMYKGNFDVVCLLQPTVPLRLAADIDQAVDRLLTTADVDSVVSITSPMDPPHWAITETSDGYLQEAFEPEVLWGEIKRSQDLPETWVPNGAIFTATTEAWEKYESFYTPQTAGYEMPPKRSIDIDEPWELELVRALFEYDRTDN